MNTDVELDAIERRKIRRSLLHLSFVFFLIYTPYRCLECIQSSLNFEEGLGATSIGVLQGGNFISCLFIGAPFVYKFGPKRSMFISFCSYTLFIMANFHPTWITMMPASIPAGIMSAIIWVAQGTYVTLLAQRYTHCSKQGITIILSKFSAVFHLFWGASSPVGNLLASLVLGFSKPESIPKCFQNIITNNGSLNHSEINDITYNASNIPSNITSNTSAVPQCVPDYASNPGEVCGVNHCPYMDEHLDVLEKPNEVLVYILMSMFLVFNIVGIIACAFIENVSSQRNSSAREKLMQTIKLVRNPNLILMIAPFTLVGMLPGIFYGNFAQSFVSCVFGIGLVGYSLMCEGLGFTFACLVCGPLTQIVPRQAQLASVFSSLIAIAIFLLFWVPSVDEFWAIILVSFVFGIMHGLHRTQLSALTSLLYPNDPEPAFAHYHLGRTSALCFTFLISPLTCFTLKAYIFLITVCMATMTYFLLEIKLHLAPREVIQIETCSVEDPMSQEKFLGNEKRIASFHANQQGSLSGSCTNVNIQP